MSPPSARTCMTTWKQLNSTRAPGRAPTTSLKRPSTMVIPSGKKKLRPLTRVPMAVPPPSSEKMLLVLTRSIKVTEVTLKLTCHPLRTLSNVTLMLSCAAGPRIVKPPTTMETVTEILTVKIVLTRIPPITQTCALLTWIRAPLLVDSNQTDLLNSLETVTMERELSIAMGMHGVMTSMIPSLATGPTISSTFQCMITCINAVMLRIFLVLPCVDVLRKCPWQPGRTVPRLI
mmetsp:Transcript_19886/g.29463  ORF Transcript_19886/g.29463 Transcript_19886/m.29463 type:complete len:232 (-) Transcript_19886:567-1262(-)